MAGKKAQQGGKIKKKHWAPILAPKVFDHAVIGEAHVLENEELLKKNVSVNLMTLTDDPRKQGFSIRFDVKDVKEGKAHTQAVALQMTPSAVKRLMRRGRDKVDDSFTLKIAGGRAVRVKPVLVTNTKCSKATQTDIRLAVRRRLRDYFARMKFEDIVKEIVDTKVQRMLKDIAGKTHPVRSADIREIFVLPNDIKVSAEMEALIEKEVAEEEARRATLANAAAAAGVGEESISAPKSKKPKKKQLAPQEMEDVSDAGESKQEEGPEDPGV
jgi:ribosomal protein S3AE